MLDFGSDERPKGLQGSEDWIGGVPAGRPQRFLDIRDGFRRLNVGDDKGTRKTRRNGKFLSRRNKASQAGPKAAGFPKFQVQEQERSPSRKVGERVPLVTTLEGKGVLGGDVTQDVTLVLLQTPHHRHSALA